MWGTGAVLISGDRRMARRRQIYEGKAKILYEGPEPGTLIQYFKDDATAFNAQNIRISYFAARQYADPEGDDS